MSNHKDLNKDFYDDLPSMICEQLDTVFIPRFGDRGWFAKAWEEYRQHVKSSSMDDVRTPMHIFVKYIPKKELK